MRRGLSHEFGVVRLYGTFSIYSIAGETRCAGCFCTSSGWFKHIEPHRTYSPLLPPHHMACASALLWTQRTSSNLLKITAWESLRNIEPHRTYTNYTITEMARCVDVYHRSSGWFDCTEPSLCTLLQGKQGMQGALCNSSGWFKHIEPHRTYTNHIITEIARCGEVCHMRSGWFDIQNSLQRRSPWRGLVSSRNFLSNWI